MARKIFVLLLLAVILFSAVIEVSANGPLDVYVDPNYVGSEEGTKDKPYNSLGEAEAYAQSGDDGGLVYTKQADGSWLFVKYVRPCHCGCHGISLPDVTLYVLLAVLAVLLMLAGWRLSRRASRLQRG